MRNAALVFATLVATACGGGHSFPQGPDGGSNQSDGGAGTPDAGACTIQPTAVGVPIGVPSTVTIGPNGGTVVSADGALQLDIPEQALAQDTDITVTPISDLAPLGVGAAWRIEPAGLTLSVPATISYFVPAADSGAADTGTLFVAAQDAQGTWQAQGAAIWSPSGGVAFAQAVVPGGGDYAVATCTALTTDEELLLSPAVAHLAVVTQCQTPPTSGLVGCPAPVGSPVTWSNQAAGGGAGLGTLAPSGASATLTPPDTAPTTAPDTIVTATTDVAGLRSGRMASLQRTISMAGFVEWSVEGTPYVATYGGNVITVTGTTNLSASDFDRNASLAIAFTGGAQGGFTATSTHAEVQGTNQLIYDDTYTVPCTTTQKQLTTTVAVTRASIDAHIMFGSFKGTLAITRGTKTCPNGTEPDVVEVPLEGAFRLLWTNP